MARKSLNDVLSNDRSIARQAQGGPLKAYYSSDKDWGDNDPGKPGSTSSWAKDKWGSGTTYESCHVTHPPLKFTDKETGKEIEIFGGSCINPKVPDANIYMGFDRGMQITARAFPWNPGVEVLFPIPDMGVPPSIGQFQKMVHWTAEQLREGKKIHCGCIGGHGRTGMFFAALVKHMTGDEDATTYVRTHYCKKVVESKAQVDWLFDNWGIKKVDGYKSGLGKGSALDYGSFGKSSKKGSKKPKGAPRGSEEIFPMGRDVSIFAGSG